MKVKINKDFKDKYTGERYTAGDVKEFDDDRAAELLADPRALVSEVKEAKKAKKPLSKKKK